MIARFQDSVFVKFVVVGVLSTILNYAVFAVLLRGLHVQYLVASAIGYCSGLIFGYFLNRNWTFASEKAAGGQAQSREFVLYLAIYLFSLGVGLLLLRLLTHRLGVDPRLGNLLVIAVETTINFLGLRFLVFSQRPS